MKNVRNILLLAAILALPAAAQPQTYKAGDTEMIEKVIAVAVSKLGGAKYRDAKTLSSRGKLSMIANQRIDSFQSFVDVVIYPDKERTDFEQRGAKTVQVNVGDEGWIYDEQFELFGPQTEKQIENFKRSLKTHYDFLLREQWKGNAEISYRGRRRASLGKRNDVVRLEFDDGFWVEYEFADTGLPMKTVYPSKNPEGIEILEENRYAQYILTDGGILFPFIVDHFVEGKRAYRVNYVEARFNNRVSDSIFVKPAKPKKIKKLKI